MTAREVIEQVEHFQRRILQDAMQEATRSYWLRRARQFEACLPQPGDYRGQASLEQLRDQWRRTNEVVKACRNKAEMALVEEWPEVDEVLAERWAGEAA